MSNSSSSNGTSAGGPLPCPSCDTSLDIGLKVTALCVLIAGALVFNLLVVIVFWKNPQLHKTVNYFLVNMAVSDLFCPFVAIPKRLTILLSGSSVWHVKGTAGLALCKLQPLLHDLSPAVSTFTIICITIDRFYAVMRPFRTSLIPDRARQLIIAFIWVFAIINYSPYFYVFKLANYQGSVFCVMDWRPLDRVQAMTIYTTYLAMLYGILPWILVALLYCLIVIGLRRAKERVQANAQHFVQHRRIANVTRQALAIVVAFGVCSFPLSVLFFIIAYYYKFNLSSPPPYWQNLYFSAEFLAYSNAVINPCICLFLNENYRSGLWRLFRRNNRVQPEVVREELPVEPITRSTK